MRVLLGLLKAWGVVIYFVRPEMISRLHDPQVVIGPNSIKFFGWPFGVCTLGAYRKF